MGLLIALFIATLGAVSQTPLPGETDEMLRQLSKVRIDKKQIYNVRDIRIRRDVLSIALNRGLIAFLEPVAGRVTGAVFIGSAEIVAIPPEGDNRSGRLSGYGRWAPERDVSLCIARTAAGW